VVRALQQSIPALLLQERREDSEVEMHVFFRAAMACCNLTTTPASWTVYWTRRAWASTRRHLRVARNFAAAAPPPPPMMAP